MDTPSHGNRSPGPVLLGKIDLFCRYLYLIGELGSVILAMMKFHPSIMHLPNCIIMISVPNGVLSCLHKLFFHHLYTISWLSVMKLFEVEVLLPIMASPEDI